MTSSHKAYIVGTCSFLFVLALSGCAGSSGHSSGAGGSSLEVRSGVYSGREGAAFTLRGDEREKFVPLISDAVAIADCTATQDDGLPGGLYLTWEDSPSSDGAKEPEPTDVYVARGHIFFEDKGCSVPATGGLIDALQELASRELPSEELAILELRG
jgi:hypothetical protein